MTEHRAGLRQDDAQLLGALQRAGGRGHIVQGQVAAACRLSLFGLIVIGPGDPQPLVVTPDGRATSVQFGGWAA